MKIKLVGGHADGITFEIQDNWNVFQVPYGFKQTRFTESISPDATYGVATYEVKRIICESREDVIFAIPHGTTVKSALIHLLNSHRESELTT